MNPTLTAIEDEKLMSQAPLDTNSKKIIGCSQKTRNIIKSWQLSNEKTYKDLTVCGDSDRRFNDFTESSDDEFIIDGKLPRRKDHVIDDDNNSQYSVVRIVDHFEEDGRFEFDTRFSNYEKTYV